MGNYFKSWRRKFGVVTLVMACVFASGWVRSRNICDTIRVRVSVFNHVFLESNLGRLMWLTTFEAQPVKGRYSFYESGKSEDRSYQWRSEKENRWKALGFEYSRISHGQSGVGYYPKGGQDWIVLLIPYSSIVIPLTLLSTWLLVSKAVEVKSSIENRATSTTERHQPR